MKADRGRSRRGVQRKSEKVVRVGIVKGRARDVYLGDDDIVRRVIDGRVEKVKRVRLVREAGFRYYVDGEGDISRKPDPDFIAPATHGLPRQKLPAFAKDRRLGLLEFAEIDLGWVRILESTSVPKRSAWDIYRAARASYDVTSLSPVLVDEALASDRLELIEEDGERERTRARKLSAATFFARRERELRKASRARPDDEEVSLNVEAEWAKLRALSERSLGEKSAPARRFSFQAADASPSLRLLLVSCESWELPAVLQFGGWNDCPAPDEQAAVLRHFLVSDRAELVHIGGDYLEMTVSEPPSPRRLKNLAWEQFLFAPDFVEQGTSAVAALARELRQRLWFFWWD